MRRRLTGAFWIGLSELVVLVAVAAMAAVLGLVVVDLLPDAVAWHWWAFVVTLAMMVGSIFLHRYARRVAGTLYYVRLLDEGMSDYQVESLRSAHRRRMALRWVARWVDLAARTDGGMTDVVQLCQQLSAMLADRIGVDSDETGYAVAPNMLWPIAVAVGVDLPFIEGMELVELRGSARRRPGRADELSFRLHRRPPDVELTIVTEEFELDGASGDRFGLHLAFTRPGQLYRPESFRNFGVSSGRVLRPSRDVADREYDSAELAFLATELPELVAVIKHEADRQGRELVLMGMVPKTVAFALGWGLGQARCRFFSGTYLLYRDRDRLERDPASWQFDVMRVHPSQPAGFPR